MRRRSKALIALVAVAVIAMGMIGIGAASADEPRRDCGGRGWLGKRAEIAEAVGKKLGISGDEVRSAFRAVIADRLDQSVKDGKVTQEQAEKARTRPDEGALGGCGPWKGSRHEFRGQQQKKLDHGSDAFDAGEAA
ncbi:MAG: hypothetical protein ACRDZ4_04825 [Egibacteraceae bacterium]